MKNKYILLLILLLTASNLLAQPISMLRADKYYDQLNYAKALEKYLATESKSYSPLFKKHVHLRIGDCYRLMNDTENAEKWYAGTVPDKDVEPIYYYYYAQVLKANKKYDDYNDYIEKFNSLKDDKLRVDAKQLPKSKIQELMRFQNKFKVFDVPFNSPYSDYSPTFFGDKLLFVTSRDSLERKKSGWTNEAFYNLYVADFSGGDTSNLVAYHLSKNLGTKFHEGPASYVPQDSVLFFTRNNSTLGRKGRSKESLRTLQILSIRFKNGEWGDLWEFPYNNVDYSFGHPTLTKDGKTMYFASNMPGGQGGTDLYVTHLVDSVWSEPENLGQGINTAGNEMFPFIHETGILYFASNGHITLGGLDVFYTVKDGSGFTKPENIGAPINSSKDDFGLIMDDQRMRGYFSSNRNFASGDDIYEFIVLPEPPVAVLDTLTVEKNEKNIPVFPLKNDIYGDIKEFYISEYTPKSSRGGIVDFEPGENKFIYTPKTDYFGFDTIYYTVCDTFSMYPGKDTTGMVRIYVDDYFYGVKGIVVYKESQAPVDSVQATLLTGDLQPIDSVLTGESGTFKFSLDKNTDYAVKMYKRGLLTKTQFITTIGMPEGEQEVKEVVELQKLEIGAKFAINIYFDTGKHNIRQDAAKEIDQKVYQFLIDNPTVTIELSAHTDSRGSKNSNQALSQRRANSTVEYLLNKGIAKARMVAKGYGEEQLVNRCADGVRCSEEEHQANRRVEVKVLSF